MDKFTRFSDYDVFAYIASGLAAFVVWDIVFSTHYVLGAQWTVASGTLVSAFAYIIGQILAAPSAWLIERQFVYHVLLRPSIVLMDDSPLKWRRFLKRTILQDYYRPLDVGLRKKVVERTMVDQKAKPTGDALFWCAFPVAKKDANAYARMETFLKLYGFCRNIAFMGLSGSALIAAYAVMEWTQLGWSDDIGRQFRFALFALLIGLGMLHRYLKFFRLYAVEVLVAYCGAPEGIGIGGASQVTKT